MKRYKDSVSRMPVHIVICKKVIVKIELCVTLAKQNRSFCTRTKGQYKIK